jgi:hypothetical protein
LILVSGDSWSCGSWRNAQLTSSGISGCMIDHGLSVINLGIPGGSNLDVTRSLKQFLQQNTHINVSLLVVFQTEYTRELELVYDDIDAGYQCTMQKTVAKFYTALDNLGIKTLLIGGASDTWAPEQVHKDYSNLFVACQSMTNFVINNNPNVKDPVLSTYSQNTFEIVEAMKRHGTSADNQDLISAMDHGGKRLLSWGGANIAQWPDGYHPAQECHARLFDYITHQNFLKV